MSLLYSSTISCCFYNNSMLSSVLFFFFNDTSATAFYTLSLHDALPILVRLCGAGLQPCTTVMRPLLRICRADRKSTRLNSSHLVISYAVFCLKKKKNNLKELFN